jgi:hypothetical protein
VSGPSRAALRPLYEATRYLVHHPRGTLAVRIGEVSPALDALLAAEDVSEGVFITAANPRSRKMSATENEAANRTLAEALDREGYRALPHEGVAEAGDWHEHGFFVLALGPREALRWAERFGQCAIVHCAIGRAASLLFTRLAAGEKGA